MGQAKKGDKVTVHYTGKLEDGTVFDSSQDKQPLEFTLGEGQIIPGFEDGIVGMDVGDTKSITIPPEKAYGNNRDDLIIEVNKADIPDNIKPSIGQQLQIKQSEGDVIGVTITAMTEKSVTLDANHPLAGKTLLFDVELVAVA